MTIQTQTVTLWSACDPITIIDPFIISSQAISAGPCIADWHPFQLPWQWMMIQIIELTLFRTLGYFLTRGYITIDILILVQQPGAKGRSRVYTKFFSVPLALSPCDNNPIPMTRAPREGQCPSIHVELLFHAWWIILTTFCHAGFSSKTNCSKMSNYLLPLFIISRLMTLEKMGLGAC